MLVLKTKKILFMKKIIITISVVLIGYSVCAQNGNDSVSVDTSLQQLEADTSGHPIILESKEGFTLKDSIKYSASYQFRDGFYIGRKSFLNNQPITLDKVLTTIPYTDPDIYAKILTTGSFEAMQEDSTYKYYGVDRVFGFVQNRVLYVNLGQMGFVRMSNFGRICKVTYDVSAPRIQPTAGVGMNSWGGAGVGVGVQINGGSQITEYIFRIDEGPIVEFTPEMLLEMIKDDEIMFNNYVGMNKRYRLKEMQNVLREYNRRNPLYLPIYK
jgi:hypothetical protein